MSNMQKDTFKKRLKEIGISQKKFASITGHGYSTVKGWQTIPAWANIVLDCLDLLAHIGSINNTLKSLEDLNGKVQKVDFLNKPIKE